MKTFLAVIAVVALSVAGDPPANAQDPLPSWNDGPAKKSITEFVAKVTKARLA